MTTIGNKAQTWGTRSQIGATIDALKDVQGNKDGIHGNESKAKGSVPDAFDRQPLAAKAKAALSVGFSVDDEIRTLKSFRASREAEWGKPVVSPDVESRLKNPDLYAAQKSISLARLGLTPDDVVDRFISAKGSVDGRAIAPREIFTSEYAPQGTPSGAVVVVSPGFQETGRSFESQIVEMTKRGHTVVVMDHQWAGQSDGSPGGVDSGFGVARDVAAVAAHAAARASALFGDAGRVVLFGNSMGAGPGVLGALTMNDQGRIKLDGAQMPKGLDAVLQAPFLGIASSPLNKTLEFASKLPLLNRIRAPSAGVPDLTNDRVAEAKGAQGAVLEDVRAQLSTFESTKGDLTTLKDMIASGQGPTGRIAIVHGERDTLADFSASEAAARALGERATFTRVDTSNHVMQESPTEMHLALSALDDIISED
jgi:alpha-beta hydrolase superfamily lysophospholipase